MKRRAFEEVPQRALLDDRRSGARCCRRAAAALALSAAQLVFIQGSVLANPSPRLLYSRGEGTEQCPGEQALRDAVAARLGYDPFARGTRSLIVASIAMEGDALKGTVEYRDETGAVRGQRELQSLERDCAELAEAMAFTIVLLLDPRSVLGPAPRRADWPLEERKAPSATEKPPPEDIPAARAAKPTGGAATPVVFRASVGVLGAIGAAPAPAFGLEALIGLEGSSWALDLEGRLDLPVSTTTAAGYGVRSSLLLATLAPCYRRAWLRTCALLSLGSLSGEGVAIDEPHHKAAFHAAVGTRLAFELPLTQWLGLRVHADVHAALTRTTLAVADKDVWTTPPLSAVLGCGLAAKIW